MEFINTRAGHREVFPSKKVHRLYRGRFKPDLAQIFGAGSSDPSRGLLFYENIGFPVEKMEFGPFSKSWGNGKSFRAYALGKM